MRVLNSPSYRGIASGKARPPASGGGGTLPTFNNEPVGATRLRFEQWNVGNTTYRSTYDVRSGSARVGSTGNWETITDSTAPYTGQLDSGHADFRKVGRAWGEIGDLVGSSSWYLRNESGVFPPSNWATVYVAGHYRLSTPYSWQNSASGIGGIQKNMEIWIANDAINYEFCGGDGQVAITMASNDPAINHRVGVVVQAGGADDFTGDGDFAAMQWVKFESLVTRATKRVQIWANDAVMYNQIHSDLDDAAVSRIEFLTLFGGVGGNVEVECYTDWDWVLWSYTT